MKPTANFVLVSLLFCVFKSKGQKYMEYMDYCITYRQDLSRIQTECFEYEYDNFKCLPWKINDCDTFHPADVRFCPDVDCPVSNNGKMPSSNQDVNCIAAAC